LHHAVTRKRNGVGHDPDTAGVHRPTQDIINHLALGPFHAPDIIRKFGNDTRQPDPDATPPVARDTAARDTARP
jgi:hypothetical protein